MRRGRLLAIALVVLLLGIAGAHWLLPSEEAQISATLSEVSRAAGLSGKAAPSDALKATLQRYLTRAVDVWTPQMARSSVPRDELIEWLEPLAQRHQGRYSLYDVRIDVKASAGAKLRADVRAELGPADRRRQVQGLEARALQLEMERTADTWVISSIELHEPQPMQPEARP